jgi:hypothetical protein
VPSQYKNYLAEFQSLLQPQTISYTPVNREQLTADLKAALRPGYDLAIKQRQDQTARNKAELDADAYARGMGASTYLSDVKNRQSNYEADDVATLESQYSASLAQQLMQALQAEKANQFAADQYNASARSNAQAQALSLAGNFYDQFMSQAQGTRGRSGPTKEDGLPLSSVSRLESYADTMLAHTKDINSAIKKLEQSKSLDSTYGKGATDYLLAYIAGTQGR